MKSPIVCLVSDGRGDAVTTLERIRVAASAGVDVIQIREPRLPDRMLLDLVRGACERAAHSGTTIVVNDRLDIALAAGAHGVHLRGTSFAAPRVRLRTGNDFVVGRSVHTLDEALAAERAGGCDYLLFGTVFVSASKPEGHPTAGLAALREVCARVRLPILAIGGVTRANVGDVASAGAAGIAAISLFADVESIAGTVEFVRRTFDT